MGVFDTILEVVGLSLTSLLTLSGVRELWQNRQSARPIDWQEHPEFFIRGGHVRKISE